MDLQLYGTVSGDPCALTVIDWMSLSSRLLLIYSIYTSRLSSLYHTQDLGYPYWTGLRAEEQSKSEDLEVNRRATPGHHDLIPINQQTRELNYRFRIGIYGALIQNRRRSSTSCSYLQAEQLREITRAPERS